MTDDPVRPDDTDSDPPGDTDSGPPGDTDSGPPGDTDGGDRPGDHDTLALRTLPALPLRADRRDAVARRAGDAFEEAHRGRVRVQHATRLAFAVVLTGAMALYLLWAMTVARTFG